MEGGYPFQSKVYDTVKLFYNYPLSRLAQAPQYSYAMVKYEDLVRHPSQVIQAVCLHLGFQVTPQLQEILEEEEEKARNYISSHVYSLDQFQVSREQIISDLDHVFKRFNFSTIENDQEEKMR
jgi:K+ transporter